MSEERERGSPIRLSGDWIARADVALKRKGWKRQDLAKVADTSGASITRLFDNQTTDVVASKVAAALGLEDPAAEIVARAHADWMDVGARLRRVDPKQYFAVLNALQMWLRAEEAFSEAQQALSGALTRPRGRERSEGDDTT